MFGSDYFGKDYFGQDYFANELVVGRPNRFFDPMSSTFLDQFNRTNGNVANSWTVSSNAQIQIIQNELYLDVSDSAGVEHSCIQSNLLSGSNKYVQCQIRYSSVLPTDVTVFLVVSWTDINNFVALKSYVDTGIQILDIIKRVGGVNTVLATYSGPYAGITTTGQQISLSQVGDVLTARAALDGDANGFRLISTYTGTVIKTTSVGFVAAGNGGGSFPIVDDFQAGMLGGSSGGGSGGRRRRGLLMRMEEDE